MIIGAPRAQSQLQSFSDIDEPGAVYKCSLFSEETDANITNCQSLIMDKGRGNVKLQVSQKYKKLKMKNVVVHKENQLLGAAIDGSDADNGTFVVCAPNMKTFNGTNNDFYHGICYVNVMNRWGGTDIIEYFYRDYSEYELTIF